MGHSRLISYKYIYIYVAKLFRCRSAEFDLHDSYGGWLADSYEYMDDPPDTIGWSTTVTDNGFVDPNHYSDPNIICHRGAAPSSIGGAASPGSTIDLEWTTWPDSHHGPVLDYLAPVSGDFASIDKESLEWVKVDAGGLISGSNPGTWATDQLIANNNTWSMTLPSDLAPGKYVLRHEIIALHAAGQPNGAQNYPQCVNLEVSGSGSASPSGGEPATQFYTPNDPGILFNLYAQFDSYPIPGPPVWNA